MDEESGTTVALPCLLRGRCYSFTLYMHGCVGKYIELRNITKIVLSPSLVCAVVILSTSRK